MIRIDGGFGEGGGQILRTAIALSCITGEDVEVYNIRANRPKPGLKAQHLKGVEVAREICDADVEGLRIGSTRVVFRPKELRIRDMKIDIGTAGSITLLLQTVLPPIIHEGKDCRLEITGGTDVSWSPSIDYLRFVTLEALKEMGADVDVQVLRRGYYPKGGGKVVIEVRGRELRGKAFRESECREIVGISHCSNLPKHVAERQAKSAGEFLESRGYITNIAVETQKGFSTGSGITLFCGYKGSVSLGEKGKPAEKVGMEAGMEIFRELNSDGAFDRHLADQIMVFGFLAHGKTSYTTTAITDHALSNSHVINSFSEGSVIIEERKIFILRRY